ncbi:MAG: acylphosphatase [Nitrososphaerales archaeon]
MEASGKIKRARIIILGNIQGFGYRALVKQAAISLGIRGLVRNRPDGGVEVFMEGAEEAMDKLIGMINIKGDPKNILSLNVSQIGVFREGEEGHSPAWRGYQTFEIDYGAEELRIVERETLDSLEWAKLHFASLTGGFRDYRNEFREFAKRTDDNFKLILDKYGEISEKLTRIMDTLIEESRKSRDMLKVIKRDSKETRKKLIEALRLLRKAIEKSKKK